MSLIQFLKKLNNIQRLVLVFCFLAALRVFLFAAAYPFFGNADEWAHFDMVIKYRHGHFPKSLETVSPESARYIATYSSLEYMLKKDNIPGKQFPLPLWKQPKEKVQEGIDKNIALWCTYPNHESTMPPLYYLLAGMWTNLGLLFGANGIGLLYWIRFLNVILAALLVWLAYLAALALFPKSRIMLLGVPLLAAILPQDSFYSIQSDVLSPVCFGLAFLGMIRLMRNENARLQTAILTGLAIVATVFVKTSNLPLVALVILFVLYKVYLHLKERKPFSSLLPTALFALCALLPVLIWFAWNLYHYGDLTASEGKIVLQGWTHKPLKDFLHHPFFTLHGAWTFWAYLMTSFWRGELVWAGAQVGMFATDIFYWVSTLVFVVVASLGIRRIVDNDQRRMIWFALWCFVFFVLYLLLLSLSFDFGKCFYPSKEFPYFVSGRLISAALIPLLLLYIQGLKRSLFWIKNESLQFTVLIAIAVFITVSEIIVNWLVFASQYNFFHL